MTHLESGGWLAKAFLERPYVCFQHHPEARALARIERWGDKFVVVIGPPASCDDDRSPL